MRHPFGFGAPGHQPFRHRRQLVHRRDVVGRRAGQPEERRLPRVHGPGDLRIDEIPAPVPGPRDVLVRVLAASVSSADMRVRTQKLPRGFGLLGRLAFGTDAPALLAAARKVNAAPVAIWLVGIAVYHLAPKVLPGAGSALPALAFSFSLAWATRPRGR